MSTARVKLAEKTEDRPRASTLIAVAVSALCAGLATARGIEALAVRTPSSAPKAATEPALTAPPASPEAEPEATAAGAESSSSSLEAAEAEPPARPRAEPRAPAPEPPPAAAAAVAVAAREPEPEPRTQRPPSPSEAPAPTLAARPAIAAAPPAPTPEPERAASANANVDANSGTRGPIFQMGIVAYDRCDGLPQLPGRFPCPRDLKLEHQVWEALRALETCKLAQAQRGEGEVRYEWSDGARMQLKVRGPKRAAVDHAVVTKCTGRALGAARTSLGADHMIVRFRFELR